MNLLHKTCLLLPLLGLAVAGSVRAQALDIRTEDLPPYAYYEGGNLTGASVEIVQRIMARLDRHEPIAVYPWARAYQQLLTANNVVLFTVAKTREREPLFQWVGPIAVDKTFFYKASGSTVTVKKLAEAKDRLILVTRDYPEDSYLKSQGFSNVYLTVNPETNWKMLAAGRGDLTISGTNAINSTLKRIDLERSQFERVGPVLFQTELYIAMSLGMPKNIVKEWQKALDGLVADGTVSRIRSKYSQDE